MSTADYILLVKDDVTIAEVVTAYLSEAGYRVTHQERGQAALELAAAVELRRLSELAGLVVRNTRAAAVAG